MEYQFKRLPELYWAVFVAVAMVVLQAALTFNADVLSDPKTYGVALLAAIIRAAAGAAIAWFRPGSGDDNPEPPTMNTQTSREGEPQG